MARRRKGVRERGGHREREGERERGRREKYRQTERERGRERGRMSCKHTFKNALSADALVRQPGTAAELLTFNPKSTMSALKVAGTSLQQASGRLDDDLINRSLSSFTQSILVVLKSEESAIPQHSNCREKGGGGRNTCYGNKNLKMKIK